MKVLVITTVYPNKAQPNLGIFVRERIKQLAKLCDVKVLAPVPYFPPAGILKDKYRYRVSSFEYQQDIEVYHPKFLIIPGLMKFLDGFLLYLSSVYAAKKIQKKFSFDLIDAHFAYPDGFAAVLLGKHFKKPVTITLRGTLNHLIRYRIRKREIKFALKNANKVFSVSAYLSDLAKSLGVDESKFEVIPNGVDTTKFQPLDKFESRRKLGIPPDKKVIVSVGALVNRKGHHRIIEILPMLTKKYSNLLCLIVGGASVEGDMSEFLKDQVKRLNLENHVFLAGEVSHALVKEFLCASDIFALATQSEGWPNVFLEAMACGIPVVTTNVCGNHEVVREGETGLLVPFGDPNALLNAMDQALSQNWDREKLVNVARSRSWDKVAQEVYQQFLKILNNYDSK